MIGAALAQKPRIIWYSSSFSLGAVWELPLGTPNSYCRRIIFGNCMYEGEIQGKIILTYQAKMTLPKPVANQSGNVVPNCNCCNAIPFLLRISVRTSVCTQKSSVISSPKIMVHAGKCRQIFAFFFALVFCLLLRLYCLCPPRGPQNPRNSSRFESKFRGGPWKYVKKYVMKFLYFWPAFRDPPQTYFS